MAGQSGDKERNLTIIVPGEAVGERLDRFLGSCVELGLSRTRIQSLIADGQVRLDDALTTGKHLCKGGERIDIIVPPRPASLVEPENIALSVLYEDEHLLIVDKPAGMVTHPAVGNRSGTLVNALMHYFHGAKSAKSLDRAGIVHRLDKNTSGLLLVARKEPILVALQQALERREIARTYLGLVCGHMVDDEGTIDLAIGRSTRDRTRMAVSQTHGRTAVTRYRLKDRFRAYDLLEISLQTGRTHQIRVHFSHRGHPIFGDPEYGGRESWHRGIFAPERLLAKRLLKIMPRQALHAQRLEFVHPATGKKTEVNSELPADFRNLLSALEKDGH